MLSHRTLFVVGAGSSCELGLPAGDGLKDEIEKILEGDVPERFRDDAIQQAILDLGASAGADPKEGLHPQFISAAQRLRRGLPFAQSIDNFLHRHSHDPAIVGVGKIAITRAILDAENRSYLGKQGREDARLQGRRSGRLHPKLSDSWHIRLIRLLTAGKSIDGNPDLFDGVSFVIFNYDRCLEHFLYTAVQAHDGISGQVAAEILQKVEFLHPYGQVGSLPWQGGAPEIEFGGNPGHELFDVSKGILTFTETVDRGIAERVKSLVAEADTIVFMGFGFLQQNVELLRVRSAAKVRRVFLTTKGISDDDVPVVLYQRLTFLLKKSIARENAPVGAPNLAGVDRFVERDSCSKMMQNHWLRLTSG